jgi:hypothetical protein
MKSYQDAAKYLGSKIDRPLGTGRATRIRRIDSHSIGIRYHSTDVVTYLDSGTAILNSGGYRTVTTKERINKYTGARVSQTMGLWYVACGSLFYDGMVIDPAGLPVNPISPVDTEIAKRKLDRMVSKYVKGFVASIQANGLADPSNGDCWGCCMKTTDGRQNPMGVSHFFSHFEEKYYVPSLLWNALCSQGYANPSLIWALIKNDCERHVASWYAANSLRRYFRNLKTALLAEMQNSDPVTAPAVESECA